MVLGVHSLDQVLFAIMIAVWAAFMFEYCVRRDLMDHVMRLNQNKLDNVTKLSYLAIFATLVTIVALVF